MARNRKRMALYEVIGKKRVNVCDSRRLEGLQPEKSGIDIGRPEVGGSDAGMVEKQVKWPTRPRILQLNAGRVEISMPYQLAVAVILGILLLALVCFRLGQTYSLSGKKADMSASNAVAAMPHEQSPLPPVTAPELPATTAVQDESKPENEDAPIPQPGNVIVIQSMANSAQLEPVKNYFAGKGIETEIIAIRGTYFLITKQRYEQNPKVLGTEGYIALQKIIKLGSEYKSPQGYGSFGSKPFSDAYGMKLK